MRLLDRLRGRKQAVPQIDPPGYRSAPPPPPIAPATPIAAPEAQSVRPAARPAMRLMLADGTLQDLPPDPEMEARAEYLIKSMLPPAPPPPPASS